MKVMIILITHHLSLITSSAQTFTQRVQQHAVNEGVVTIHHDQNIDELVNGHKSSPQAQSTAQTPAVKPAGSADNKEKGADKSQTTAQATKSQAETTSGDSLATTANTGPKRTYKTTGYRVQVFAGGNTRRDRQKAEHTGNTLRQLYPDEDVYVHFYSPRWICRIGNYLTYAEAREMMLEIKKLGYETAIVVKGKITITR